jgi:hypothetical protein
MNATEKENLRRAILTVADANLSRYGLSVVAFKLHVSNLGFPEASAEQIQPEVQYLAEKELLVEVPKHLSPENRLWRITAKGRDFIAANAV